MSGTERRLLIPAESQMVQRTQVVGQGLLVVHPRDLPSLESVDSPRTCFLSPAKHFKAADALRGSAVRVLGAEMPEGQSLYLLKLVSRILIQTCCLSKSYILVSTYRNNVKKKMLE